MQRGSGVVRSWLYLLLGDRRVGLAVGSATTAGAWTCRAAVRTSCPDVRAIFSHCSLVVMRTVACMFCAVAAVHCLTVSALTPHGRMSRCPLSRSAEVVQGEGEGEV